MKTEQFPFKGFTGIGRGKDTVLVPYPTKEMPTILAEFGEEEEEH